MKTKILTIFALAVLVAACEETEPTFFENEFLGANIEYTSSDNSDDEATDTEDLVYIFKADNIGIGSENEAVLKRKIDVEFINLDSKFKAEEAYVTRDYIGSPNIFIFIRFSNISNTFVGDVTIKNAEIYDNNGTLLDSDSYNFLIGKNGKNDYWFDNSCLAPDEFGFFRIIFFYADFDKISKIVCSDLEYNLDFQPANLVRFSNYSYNDEKNTLNLPVENLTLYDLEEVFTTVIYLNDNFEPLSYDFIHLRTDDDILPYFGTSTMETSVSYKGTATQIFVSSGFSPADKKNPLKLIKMKKKQTKLMTKKYR